MILFNWLNKNVCKDCYFYRQANNVCISKKCSTCGTHLYSNWFDKHFCKTYKCLGGKNIYICKVDFEVTGDYLEEITIKKGSLWELVFINNDYVLLHSSNNRELSLKRDIFDLEFEKFDCAESEGGI